MILKTAQIAGLLLCALNSGTTIAQVSVFPAAPIAYETVRVQAAPCALGSFSDSPDNYDPAATTVVMANNKVVVTLLMIGGSGFPVCPLLDWPLGQLPPGSYEVELRKRRAGEAGETTVGTASFVVSARSPQTSPHNFTDLYWNPFESGWGLSVTQLTSGGLFLVWFLYDNENRPTWYFVSDGEWTSRFSFRGTLYRSEGSPFALEANASYDPTRFRAMPVGSAEIFFAYQQYEAATLTFTIDGFRRTKLLRRQRL